MTHRRKAPFVRRKTTDAVTDRASRNQIMSKSAGKNSEQLTFEHYARSDQEATDHVQTKQRRGALTVSELTAMIRTAIRDHLPATVLVTGEVSNLSRPRSGHVYFTLKDEKTQINCAMWRPRASKLRFELADGLAVLAEGSVDIYAPRGQYQLYVEKLQPYGLGELELAFKQLRERLSRQGLFDPAHKKPIPSYPLTIAVVTSISGAAVRDILRTLSRRWPVGRVLVYPVQVQGDGAAEDIAGAIDELNAHADRLGRIDVMIVGRGGGSLEDLWAFNEEPVARAIYRSRIPIITGIGHEVDTTIADLVADVRTGTPTAAAERAVPIRDDVLDDLRRLLDRLARRTAQEATTTKERLTALAGRGMFVHPIVLVGRFAQQLDELAGRFQRRGSDRLGRSRSDLTRLQLALGRIRPEVVFHRADDTVDQLYRRMVCEAKRLFQLRRDHIARHERMLHAFSPEKTLPARRDTMSTLSRALTGSCLARHRRSAEQLAHLHARLTGCDPKQVLKRGFAIARRAKDNKIISSVAMVDPGRAIRTELADGRVDSTVTRISAHNKGSVEHEQ